MSIDLQGTCATKLLLHCQLPVMLFVAAPVASSTGSTGLNMIDCSLFSHSQLALKVHVIDDAITSCSMLVPVPHFTAHPVAELSVVAVTVMGM